MGFSRQEYWSGCQFFPRGSSQPRDWTLGLPHCRQILYHLSHDTLADKARDFMGRGARVENQRIREPRRAALPRGPRLEFYGDGISFLVVSDQLFWLSVLPGGPSTAQTRWIPARRILDGGRTHDVSFWPFPNSSCWWWLVSSVFLTKTSYHKITHRNGYCCAWPGWVVPVSVSPSIKGALFCNTKI